MEKIIINQKMHLNTLEEINNFIRYTYYYRKKMIVLPEYIYIPLFIANDYTVGSQNISDEAFGAHTGEVSSKALADIGVKYTLIGHSELRNKYNENIDKKIKLAKKNGLKVILCIGEEEGNPIQKIEKQLENIDKDVIISYEPIWSIGTNNIPSNEEIDKIVKYIKSKGFSKVFYGGSVNEDNIEKLNEISSLDGFLIGSCTLKPDSILNMIEVVSK